jgi:hypothetical protein
LGVGLVVSTVQTLQESMASCVKTFIAPGACRTGSTVEAKILSTSQAQIIGELRRIAWWRDDNPNTLPVGWAVEFTAKQTIQKKSVGQSISDEQSCSPPFPNVTVDSIWRMAGVEIRREGLHLRAGK